MARTTKLVPPAKSGGSDLVSQSLEKGQKGEKGTDWGEATGQLVELEGKCYGEEEELVCDGDEQGDGEVVAVQDMDGSLHDE